MKIQVVTKDGEQRTVDLLEPVTIHIGTHLHHFQSGNGIDHYFTFDGFYDGFGMALSVPPGELQLDDMPGVLQGLADVAEGKVRSLADIDAEGGSRSPESR